MFFFFIFPFQPQFFLSLKITTQGTKKIPADDDLLDFEHIKVNYDSYK